MNNQKNGRRAFLAATGTMAGAGWLALNAPLLLAAGEEAAQRRAENAPWEHLDEAAAAAFAALADQVIPPDDLPGAADMGVVHFIDRALGGFMAGTVPMLREGLADLDRRAAGLAESETFAGLPFEQQTSLLREVENTPFFETVILLVHCGMFAMPSWGGNRDKAGWALIGFVDRHAWQPPFGHYDAQAGAQATARGDDHGA